MMGYDYRRLVMPYEGVLDFRACDALFAKQALTLPGLSPEEIFRFEGPAKFTGQGLNAEVNGVVHGIVQTSNLEAVSAFLGNRPMLLLGLGEPTSLEKALLAGMLGENGLQPKANPARDALHKTLDMEVITIHELGPNVRRQLTRYELRYIGQVVEKISSYTNLEAYNISSTVSKNKLERWLQQNNLDFGMDTMGWVRPDHPSRAGFSA